MALPDLHLFENDLKNRPGKGSNAPPVSIRAKDLDENYKRVTLVDPDSNISNPDLYKVRHDKDGTRITKIFADATNTGDLLYWDGNKWAVLAATSSSTLHVLTIQNGSLAWTATEDCA
jgi:hypothetical protein